MDDVPQLPPGLYDLLRATDGQRIARILSLSITLPTAAGVNWIAKREHWFSPKNLDLAVALGVSGVRLTYVSNLANLHTIAQDLATNYTFQKHAKGVLVTTDWTAGPPAFSAPAFYFVENAPSVPARAMRPLLQVSSTNAKLFSKVGWVTLDNGVTSYFAGAQVGASVTMGSTPTNTIPSSGCWHYQT